MMCNDDFTFITNSFPIAKPDKIILTMGSPSDIAPMLDEMINFTVEQVGTSARNDFAAMDKMFDEVFNSFFQDSSALADVVAAHGKELMEREEDPPRRRLACRMANMNAQPIPARSNMAVSPLKAVPRLNYGGKVDECLWERVQTDRIISPMCTAALKAAHTSFLALEESTQMSFSQAQASDYDDAYYRMEEIGFALSLLGTVLFTLSLLFLLNLVNKKNEDHRTPEMRRLKRSILQEVYANPELKAMVQSKIDQEMGDEPPIPCEHRESGDETESTESCCRCVDTCIMSLPLFALCVLLCYTSVTNPDLVMLIGGPVILLLAIYHACRLCLVPEEEEEEDQEHEVGICQNCGVETSSLCGSCGSCVNCCACESSQEVSPAVAQGYPGVVAMEKRKQEMENSDGDEEVYVAVPAVI